MLGLVLGLSVFERRGGVLGTKQIMNKRNLCSLLLFPSTLAHLDNTINLLYPFQIEFGDSTGDASRLKSPLCRTGIHLWG